MSLWWNLLADGVGFLCRFLSFLGIFNHEIRCFFVAGKAFGRFLMRYFAFRAFLLVLCGILLVHLFKWRILLDVSGELVLVSIGLPIFFARSCYLFFFFEGGQVVVGVELRFSSSKDRTLPSCFVEIVAKVFLIGSFFFSLGRKEESFFDIVVAFSSKHGYKNKVEICFKPQKLTGRFDKNFLGRAKF